MQGKLIVPKSDLKKLKSAAYFSGVKLGDAITVGNETHVETSAKDVQAYMKLGQMIGTVDGTELDAVQAAAKAKEEAKAKAAGKK